MGGEEQLDIILSSVILFGYAVSKNKISVRFFK
jgi:hypothetical protein